MSRFNSQTKGSENKTTNLAGGQAFTQKPEMELISLLLTSFASDEFYRSANDSFTRLKELIAKCDPKFVAQAAVYARTKFGMRSISHVTASELAKHVAGEEWAKDFYKAVVYRPDDMMEILSYHQANNGKIPNSMKKGFAEAFGKFDGYRLAKYRGEGKEFSLVDVVNLVHPVPTEKNVGALEALIKGELKSTETWEAKLTKAGQEAENEEQKIENKKEAWISFVRKDNTEYFALLRNLRNIIESAPEVLNEALAKLTDEKAIKKSLVLPFRYVTAYNEIMKLSSKDSRSVLIALNKAIDISCNNVPKFDGDTLVVLDVSSSMKGNDDKAPAVVGALFTAILVKANNADLITFDGSARYVNVDPSSSTLSLANALRFEGNDTNMQSFFPIIPANRKYNRVILLSDMQGWSGDYSRRTPQGTLNDYKKRSGANPYFYSFDLKNYGSLQFPENGVFCLAGFSDKIFSIMSLLEKDRNALINEVKKIEF
jgi:hypothetical protein